MPNRRSLSIVFGLLILLCTGVSAAGTPLRKGATIAVVGDAAADPLRADGYFETLMLVRHPHHQLRVRHLGWTGGGLTDGLRSDSLDRLYVELLRLGTDVVVLFFRPPEVDESVTDYVAAYSRLMTKINTCFTREGEAPQIVVISPFAIGQPGEQKSGRFESLHAGLRTAVADRKGLWVDVANPATKIANVEGIPSLHDSRGVPTLFGSWVLAQWVIEKFCPNQSAWRVTVNAKAGRAVGLGTTVTGVTTTDNGLTVSLKDQFLPMSPSPVAVSTRTALLPNAGQFAVRTLSPGFYRLSLGSAPLATVDADRWANGVVLKTSPAHQRVEEIREAVIMKNRLIPTLWSQTGRPIPTNHHPMSEPVSIERSGFPFFAIPSGHRLLGDLVARVETELHTLSKPLGEQTFVLTPVKNPSPSPK